MSTTKKGDKLEDELYYYLCDQKDRGSLVYDAYTPHLCEVYRKKKYYCAERKAEVEFDVVIELVRQGRTEPHLYVVFECKNHEGAVAERDVTDFSDKIGRIFKHAAKGVIVVSSGLQSGAENIAKNRRIGIVKFDPQGLEVIADRISPAIIETDFVRRQIYNAGRYVKSLKFSASYDGRFFSSIDRLLTSIDQNQSLVLEHENCGATVPYISCDEIQRSAGELLDKAGYKSGPVDLARICSILSLDVTFTEQLLRDAEGRFILGSANFDRRSIQVNFHENKQRERFTIGHEVGHFYFGHGRYLRSDAIVEKDLISDSEVDAEFNIERLEYQANSFASDLLLPRKTFLQKVLEWRSCLGIIDKGHGFIFVDDQPCNFGPYNRLRSELSSYFDVSMQAIETKLKRMGLLTDHRQGLKRMAVFGRRRGSR